MARSKVKSEPRKQDGAVTGNGHGSPQKKRQTDRKIRRIVGMTKGPMYSVKNAQASVFCRHDRAARTLTTEE